jgi:ABC-2 type transport system permease protein
MRAAIWAEFVKLAGSTVGRVGSAAIVIGISVLSGSMLLAAATATDPQLLAKLGPVATGDWQGFLLGAAQITGAGGLGGFAVVLAWMFGREFGDGTITGLFALPVGRPTIALAKLIVYAVWAAAMSLLLALVLIFVGTLAGLGPIDSEIWAMLARQSALGVMSAAITLPVAWAATLSRSVLGGVSVAIGLVVVAQVSVLAGLGGWMPLAAPALWAVSLGAAVTPIQLAMVIPFGAIFVVLTALSWRRMQLDR